MDMFRDKQGFPSKVDSNGNLELLAVTDMATHFIPGAIMLALRCADSETAIAKGGNQTIQLALSLTQIRGLQELLQTAALVLQTAQNPDSATH